ncbi:MAG: hypothetical protein A2Y10_00940 [Planctomycetes bacterium GWF2_41_51]|nr:MAG: hypothetical protein A2Y10_00940 [Planctomycetes bacterium GWF2_41_51]HBG26510.1 hypothetical protein [Phycisphaerales bacterium]
MNNKTIIGRTIGKAINPKTKSTKPATKPIIISGSTIIGIKRRQTAFNMQKVTLAAATAKSSIINKNDNNKT